MFGVPYDVFWHLNLTKLKPFEKAYLREMDARQNRLNLESWIQGVYIQHAIASVFSKRSKYPNKPFDMFATKKATPEEEVDAFRRFMLQHNAQRALSKETQG